MTDLLTESPVVAVVVMLLLALIGGGAAMFLRPGRHSRPEAPDLPPPPDTQQLDRDIGAADAEREDVEQGIEAVERGEQDGAASTLNDLLGR